MRANIDTIVRKMVEISPQTTMKDARKSVQLLDATFKALVLEGFTEIHLPKTFKIKLTYKKPMNCHNVFTGDITQKSKLYITAKLGKEFKRELRDRRTNYVPPKIF